MGDAVPQPNRAQRRAYVRERKVYKLRFEDEDMAGLEVRARSVPLGTFMELIELASAIEDGASAVDAGAVRQLFEGFGEALVSWNLEEPVDGPEPAATVPVPATVEGLYSQDMDFVLAVIRAWMDAVAAVPAPLAPPSAAGAPSLEASLPMEPSSPSLAS